MKEKILLGFMLAVLLVPTISAQEIVASGFTWENSCENNETLLKEITFELDGVESKLNQSVYCSNGCENDLGKYGADCVEQDYTITLWVIVGIILLFFLMVFALGRKR